MSEHTPGPWRLKDGDIVAADGTEVCWGYHEDFGALCQEIEPANAALLVKAWLLPEIVEALRDVRTHFTEEEAMPDDQQFAKSHYGWWVRRLEALLARYDSE